MVANNRGVIYVAFGRGARREARLSAESLKRYHPLMPVLVITGRDDGPVGWAPSVEYDDPGTPGRWAKVNLDRLTIWEDTLFLDADTRVYGNLEQGFQVLSQGYDLAMCPSIPQQAEMLGHLTEEERTTTLVSLPIEPLQLNTGVMWFRKTAAITKLFAEWRRQWKRWQDKDQGALLRALYQRPVRIWLMGRAFNAGTIVGHRFGACAR